MLQHKLIKNLKFYLLSASSAVIKIFKWGRIARMTTNGISKQPCLPVFFLKAVLSVTGKRESKNLSYFSFKDGRFEIVETCQTVYLVVTSTQYWYHDLDRFQLNMVHIFNAYLAFILCLTIRVVFFKFVLQLTMQLLWKVFSFYPTASLLFSHSCTLKGTEWSESHIPIHL